MHFHLYYSLIWFGIAVMNPSQVTLHWMGEIEKRKNDKPLWLKKRMALYKGMFQAQCL